MFQPIDIVIDHRNAQRRRWSKLIGHDVKKTLNQYRHGKHPWARKQGFDQEMHFYGSVFNLFAQVKNRNLIEFDINSNYIKLNTQAIGRDSGIPFNLNNF